MHLILALTVTVFAQNLEQPRTLAMLDDGTLLVSRPMLNDVLALRDRDSDGRADEIRTAVSMVDHANGLAMHGNTLYIAGASSIVSADRKPDGSFDAPQEIAGGLAGAGAIGAGPDGKLYVSMPQRGTLLQFDPDGGNRRIFARGLRSLRAFAWDPKTNELWSADDGALHRIADGGRYDLAPAASAFAFHDAAAFIASRDGIVRFTEGKPASYLEGVTPAGIAFARDGSLFFSDERKGIIYRVSDMPPPMTSSTSESHAAILAKAFHLDGLAAPASVLHDEEQDVYFVASRGSIARVSPDGRIADPKFVGGLAAPGGMAVRAKELWIADGARLHVADRTTGRRIRTIDLAPRGAVSLSAIAIGADDNVYVTDRGVRGSADGRIFRIAGEMIEVAFAGDELRAPNAIAWDGLRFLVAQGYGHDVLAWSPGGGPTAVMRGPGSYDGLGILPNGAVIVSSEYDEALHVGFTTGLGSGELHPLFTRAPSPAGIGFDRKRNRLLVPSPEGNWLEGWTLPPLEAPARPLLRRKNFETRRPPTREDRLHELLGQSLVAHLGGEALVVVGDGHEVDR